MTLAKKKENFELFHPQWVLWNGRNKDEKLLERVFVKGTPAVLYESIGGTNLRINGLKMAHVNVNKKLKAKLFNQHSLFKA